jgi:hypothetical protein
MMENHLQTQRHGYILQLLAAIFDVKEANESLVPRAHTHIETLKILTYIWRC